VVRKVIKYNREAFDKRKIRPDALFCVGVNELSTEDILGYFSMLGPTKLEWIDDNSCNIVWDQQDDCIKAYLKISREQEVLVPAEPEKRVEAKTKLMADGTEKVVESVDMEVTKGESGEGDPDSKQVKDKIAMPPPALPGVGAVAKVEEDGSMGDGQEEKKMIKLPQKSTSVFDNVLRDCIVPLVKNNRQYRLEVRLAVKGDVKMRGGMKRARVALPSYERAKPEPMSTLSASMRARLSGDESAMAKKKRTSSSVNYEDIDDNLMATTAEDLDDAYIPNLDKQTAKKIKDDIANIDTTEIGYGTMIADKVEKEFKVNKKLKKYEKQYGRLPVEKVLRKNRSSNIKDRLGRKTQPTGLTISVNNPAEDVAKYKIRKIKNPKTPFIAGLSDEEMAAEDDESSSDSDSSDSSDSDSDSSSSSSSSSSSDDSDDDTIALEDSVVNSQAAVSGVSANTDSQLSKMDLSTIASSITGIKPGQPLTQKQINEIVAYRAQLAQHSMAANTHIIQNLQNMAIANAQSQRNYDRPTPRPDGKAFINPNYASKYSDPTIDKYLAKASKADRELYKREQERSSHHDDRHHSHHHHSSSSRSRRDRDRYETEEERIDRKQQEEYQAKLESIEYELSKRKEGGKHSSSRRYRDESDYERERDYYERDRRSRHEDRELSRYERDYSRDRRSDRDHRRREDYDREAGRYSSRSYKDKYYYEEDRRDRRERRYEDERRRDRRDDRHRYDERSDTDLSLTENSTVTINNQPNRDLDHIKFSQSSNPSISVTDRESVTEMSGLTSDTQTPRTEPNETPTTTRENQSQSQSQSSSSDTSSSDSDGSDSDSDDTVKSREGPGDTDVPQKPVEEEESLTATIDNTQQ